ncbi:MAG: GH3 auxin-responsive promoter family protein [Bacteroidota bacterium]|nr:GH3 auxin-responsive promoter family protein [Bacteroidota bacterium]
MTILNSIASWWMKKRMHQIELFMKYPNDVQNECLRKLITSAKDTDWGRFHDYKNIHNHEQFKSTVPIQDYDTLKPFIDRVRRGEQNILWNTEIKWFAKSSGTTNDKSKFIPVSKESLDECHYNGGRDMLSIYCSLYPETELFTGKNLGLGGSLETDSFGSYESQNGDLSAIVMNNLPMWAEFFRSPDLSIALMDKWDEKVEKLSNATIDENIISLAGVPSWMLLIMKRVLEISGKKSIGEVWPNLEVYFHGGVNFNPYKEQFKSIFNKPDMNYLELYNASEGFFGIQDQRNSNELLLMLDYGIYYEFMPISELGVTESKTLSLDEVSTGETYALVISTNAGLWRYMLGDTIQFTSLDPFRFKITGRTKHFMNAFGEEIIVDNADKALSIACEKSGAQIKEYTAAPVYMESNENGAHEWLIEFETQPSTIEYFTEMLDNALKSINSDYEAKRYRNLILKQPIVRALPKDTFYKWFESKNKLGGQHKVPRLSNERKHVEEILQLISNK